MYNKCRRTDCEAEVDGRGYYCRAHSRRRLVKFQGRNAEKRVARKRERTVRKFDIELRNTHFAGHMEWAPRIAKRKNQTIERINLMANRRLRQRGAA